MPDDYTRREHDLIFNEIHSSLSRIEVQTTTTNGKVAEIIKWRERLMGGLTVAGIIGLPIIIWATVVLRDLPKDIQVAVKEEISSSYEVNIIK